MPLGTLSSKPMHLLQPSLQQIVERFPPKERYTKEQTRGFLLGYTGLAYLFFQLANLHPDMQVLDHGLLHWAERYMQGEREYLVLDSEEGCGLINEKLCFEAFRACLSKSDTDVQIFLSNIPELLKAFPVGEKDPYPTGIVYGRAGTLYLLRMLRRAVPNSAASLDESISQLVERMMNTDSDGKGNWEVFGDRFFGPPHGDIGIITQLLLASPLLAPRLSPKVEELINLQGPDGNWPSSRDNIDKDKGWKRVQYCHGAPGFILALQTLRPFFPHLQDQIDQAIARGQETTWKRGLLIKEPSLCHGILGNAFALPLGPKRDHFLSLCTPEAYEKTKDSFEPASYNFEMSVHCQYPTSAAWAWAVCERDSPPMLYFNDI